ncbi:hypothetical protein D5086_013852 [Populus alba]|uniref:Uncharacterized protein n=1 Tax=Populus alba TaxID=43335 RepID=A0ACC4C7Q9_POPAL
MATINFGGISLMMPELSHANGKGYGNCVSVKVVPRKRLVSVSASASAKSMESSGSVTDQKPEIELEFIGPKPEADGKYPVERAKAISGEKLLRNIMSDNKIELYAAYGKVMNCGGGGSCGTCIVEILDGNDLLNERTNTELRILNPGGSLAKQLLETKKTLARNIALSFCDCTQTFCHHLGKFYAFCVGFKGCGSEDTPVEEMIRSKAWSMTEAKEQYDASDNSWQCRCRIKNLLFIAFAVHIIELASSAFSTFVLVF